jgi:hypothetical protein
MHLVITISSPSPSPHYCNLLIIAISSLSPKLGLREAVAASTNVDVADVVLTNVGVQSEPTLAEDNGAVLFVR